MSRTSILQCACGQVRLEAALAPIVASECHCTSCRSAGARLQALPGAPRILEANGGTRFVLYRKDRVRFVQGRELLKAFRLTAGAKTRRVVATCCHSPVFLEFQSGHWLSLYDGLWPAETRPAPELRTMTSDCPTPSALDDAIPNMPRQSGRFFARLLGAWIAMGFRVPDIRIEGELEA